MRGLIDLSSWHGIISTLLGLVVVTLVAVGIRLAVTQRLQQRRERQNRQINERLKTLIAAYKTLGGSFTGNLLVDPAHLRDQRAADGVAAEAGDDDAPEGQAGSERSRRIRDAVEAALSDVILLGTAEQVKLAAEAATDMVAGRKIETSALVVSLRAFIREVLDLESIPGDASIPSQGPTRTASGSRRDQTTTGNRSRGAGAGGGGGVAAGGTLGLAAGASRGEDEPHGEGRQRG